MTNDFLSCSEVVPVHLTIDELGEMVEVAKQLSVKEALAVARKNSKVRDQGFGFRFFHMHDRRAEGLHPTRNDVDKHGRPNRKKKGSPKPKEWYK